MIFSLYGIYANFSKHWWINFHVTFYFYFDILRLYLEVSDNFMMIMMIEVQKKREKINYFWLFLAHLIKPFLLVIDELHWRIIKLVQDEPEMFDLKCCEIMYCSTSQSTFLYSLSADSVCFTLCPVFQSYITVLLAVNWYFLMMFHDHLCCMIQDIMSDTWGILISESFLDMEPIFKVLSKKY